MQPWLIWTIAGAFLITLEMLLPGGIVVFLGCSALMVALGIKLELLTGWSQGLIAWFVMSILLLFTLRSFFMKYFEGDSSVQDVSEHNDIQGNIVNVTEDILPHRDGRVQFRGTGWQARSEEDIATGSKAIIIKLEGNVLIVKSI